MFWDAKEEQQKSQSEFGVYNGKFVGYMVSARGIEANPEKIKAVINMEAPKTVRDIQKLTGRLAALRRFISRSVE